MNDRTSEDTMKHATENGHTVTGASKERKMSLRVQRWSIEVFAPLSDEEFKAVQLQVRGLGLPVWLSRYVDGYGIADLYTACQSAMLTVRAETKAGADGVVKRVLEACPLVKLSLFEYMPPVSRIDPESLVLREVERDHERLARAEVYRLARQRTILRALWGSKRAP